MGRFYYASPRHLGKVFGSISPCGVAAYEDKISGRNASSSGSVLSCHRSRSSAVVLFYADCCCR